MVCHSGISLSSGHYISYIRAPARNAAMSQLSHLTKATSSAGSDDCDESDMEPIWFLCNDDTIVPLYERELKHKLLIDRATTPYIVFYQRMSA